MIIWNKSSPGRELPPARLEASKLLQMHLVPPEWVRSPQVGWPGGDGHSCVPLLPPFPRPGVEDSRYEWLGRNGLGPVPSVEDLPGAVDPLGGVAAVLRRRVSAVGRAKSV